MPIGMGLPWGPPEFPSSDPEEEIRRLIESRGMNDVLPQQPLSHSPMRETPPAQTPSWRNPVQFPNGPDYSRVDALMQQMQNTGGGLRRFFKSTQRNDAERLQTLSQLVNAQSRMAESEYEAKMRAYAAAESKRPKYNMMTQPLVDAEGNISVVGQYGEGAPQRFNLGKGQTPGMSIAQQNAERYKERTAALKDKWQADRQSREAQFQKAESGRNSRSAAMQSGLNTRFNKGLEARGALMDPADKMQWQDLRDEEDDAQHALLQAEKYQDQDLIMRQTHRLAVVNQKQNALLEKVRGAAAARQPAVAPIATPGRPPAMSAPTQPAAPQQAPAPPAAAPQPTSPIPPKALRALQAKGEGVPVTFTNGQTWMLKNGQPVRVDQNANQ